MTRFDFFVRYGIPGMALAAALALLLVWGNRQGYVPDLVIVWSPLLLAVVALGSYRLAWHRLSSKLRDPEQAE